MPKRNPPDNNLRRQDADHRAAPKSAGPFSLFLFWPFHLVSRLTRRMAFPMRFLLRTIGYPAAAGLYLAALLVLLYGSRAQTYYLGKINEMPERSIIYDRQGEEIGRIHGEKRSIVPLDQVSEDFRTAILAREDERFYRHGAVDLIGIARASIKNLQGKREGASTISQQLASDVFSLKHGEKRGDWPRQLDRKMLEIAIAFRIESAMEKDRILEAYINQINWGRSIKGVGEASRIYFEKHPSELTLSESALLAGIVRGPDAYNPFQSMEAAIRERNTTLDRMVAAKAITEEAAAAAKEEPIDVRPVIRRQAQESYAMDAIRRDLEIILEQENINLGGLSITTTLDLRIQNKAQEALDKKLREVERLSGYPHQTRTAWRALPEESRGEPDYLQGAAVVIENRTGAILSVVGGRDADESRFNRALQAKRQIGSLFKPFVYLAAFDKGLRPDTRISDARIQRGEIAGGGNWRPNNADGKFGGLQPASYGLIRSRNTMSVRVGNYAGLQNVGEIARVTGFTTPMPESPVSFLGTWGASPREIASAYTIFPNDGVRARSHLISEIKDRDGNRLYPPPPAVSPQMTYQATSAGSAWSVSRILKEVTTSGTAASVKRLGFDKPCGGKTGTTNDFKDAWFAGYTSTLTCAVWVGFDTPKKTIQGGYGSTLSLPIWVDIMKTADRLGYKAGELNSNVNLVSMRLCYISGRRATAGCEHNETAYDDRVPGDIALDENDLCPVHPARAQPVSESDLIREAAADPPARRARPAPDAAPPARRARPLESGPPPVVEVDPPSPPRALPVENVPQPRRALPVDETPIRALPVD